MDIESQLGRVIIEMNLAPPDACYSQQEIDDAIQVYAELPDAEFVGEAMEIVDEHHRFIGSQVSLAFIGEVETEPEENSATAAAPTEVAVKKSEAQIKADRLAAEKRLKAAKLEAAAKKKEERKAGILASAANRAAAKRARADRKKQALEQRAAKLREAAQKKIADAEKKRQEAEKQAAKLRDAAAKKVAQGNKGVATADTRAKRTEKFGNFRSRFPGRAAERLRKRAETARAGAGTTSEPSQGSGEEGQAEIDAAIIASEMCMEENKYISTSIGAFHQDVGTPMCETCDTISDSLLRCAGCKTVRYCSSECQAADWNHGGHAEECDSIQSAVQWPNASGLVKARHLQRFVSALTE
jgi:hypothetical protein